MLAWKAHVGEDIVARGIHENTERGLFFAKHLSRDSALLLGYLLGVLSEYRLQHSRHRAVLLGGGMGQRVLHPLHAAARRGLWPSAITSFTPRSPRSAKDRGNSVQNLGLRGSGGHAQNFALAILVDRHGHYDGAADDTNALAHLQVGGIEPEVGPCAPPTGGSGRYSLVVDLAAEPADLALAHPARTHGFHQSSTERVEIPCT